VRYVQNTGTADERESSSIGEIVTVLKSYRTVFGRVGVAVILLAVARHSRDIFWPLWGSEIGLNAQEISVIMGLAYAVDTVPFYFAGVVMDKFGRKAAAVPCLFILSITAFGLIFTDTFLEMLIICLISGFGNGLGSGIVMTIGADLSPIRGRGEFLGAWRLIGDTGQSGGQLMLGPIAALTSLGAAIGGVGILGLCGVIVFIFIAPEPQAFHKLKSRK
jgi:MFS family permease